MLATADNTEIMSLQVIAEDDSSGKLTIELDADSVYPSNEFTAEWQALSGSPEGVKKLKFMSSMHMVDNFKVELKSWDDATVKAAGEQF